MSGSLHDSEVPAGLELRHHSRPGFLDPEENIQHSMIIYTLKSG